MAVTYQTSTNAVRQSTQALIKQWWSEIGIETELRNIDASVFFGGDPASPDTYGKFYSDVEMYTNSGSGTDPQNYMFSWRCSEVSGPDNNWLGNNVPRFCMEEYDELAGQLNETAVLEERAAIAIQLNDMLVQSGTFLPLVYRGNVSAHSNSLEGVQITGWDSEMWNIADWTRGE
jgi:peptide/nickel transport system substrate-binding protein